LKYILKKEGIKGTLPMGCFPLWGREGVILQAAAENERIWTKEDFYRAVFFNFPLVYIRYFTGDYFLTGRY